MDLSHIGLFWQYFLRTRHAMVISPKHKGNRFRHFQLNHKRTNSERKRATTNYSYIFNAGGHIIFWNFGNNFFQPLNGQAIALINSLGKLAQFRAYPGNPCALDINYYIDQVPFMILNLSCKKYPKQTSGSCDIKFGKNRASPTKSGHVRVTHAPLTQITILTKFPSWFWIIMQNIRSNRQVVLVLDKNWASQDKSGHARAICAPLT